MPQVKLFNGDELVAAVELTKEQLQDACVIRYGGANYTFWFLVDGDIRFRRGGEIIEIECVAT